MEAEDEQERKGKDEATVVWSSGIMQINFKTTDQMDWNEQFIAYILYLLIAVTCTIAFGILQMNMPRGIYIALWGLPIGVVVMMIAKRTMVSPRHIGREVVIAAIGFLFYGIFMLLMGEFRLYTLYDVYFFLIGAIIFEIGLVFFYAFYLATDTLEQKAYHAVAFPLAVLVIIVATYVATYLTRIYI